MCGPLAIPIAAAVVGGITARNAVRWVGSKLKGSPNTPAAPPESNAVPTAGETMPDESVARDRMRRRTRAAYGQQDTMLTGASGAATPQFGQKSLLGS